MRLLRAARVADSKDFKRTQFCSVQRSVAQNVSMKCAVLFDLESTVPVYVLIFSFILHLLHFLLHFFHNLEGSSNSVYSANKVMGSTDEFYSLSGYEPNAYDLKETYVESLHRVPLPATVL